MFTFSAQGSLRESVGLASINVKRSYKARGMLNNFCDNPFISPKEVIINSIDDYVTL